MMVTNTIISQISNQRFVSLDWGDDFHADATHVPRTVLINQEFFQLVQIEVIGPVKWHFTFQHVIVVQWELSTQVCLYYFSRCEIHWIMQQFVMIEIQSYID